MKEIREATAEEIEEVMDILPYAFEEYVSQIETVEHDRNRFEEFKRNNRLEESEYLFKGAYNLEEIITSGGLDVEKSHNGGTYTTGKGIYLADDPVLALSYADKKFMIVETAVNWKEIVKEGKTNNPHDVETLRKEGFSGLLMQDYGEDQHENERIVFENDAMLIRYIVTMNEMTPLYERPK